MHECADLRELHAHNPKCIGKQFVDFELWNFELHMLLERLNYYLNRLLDYTQLRPKNELAPAFP